MCKYIATHQFDREHILVSDEGDTIDQAYANLLSSACFIEDVQELVDEDPETQHVEVGVFKKLTPESEGWDECTMTEFEWYLGDRVETYSVGTEGFL